MEDEEIKQEIARRLSEYGLDPDCLSESEYKEAYDDIAEDIAIRNTSLFKLDGFWSTFLPFKYL